MALEKRLARLEKQLANQEGDVKTASVQTLTVTVRALMIDNKQVTLAVFRQLPVNDFLKVAAGKEVFSAWGSGLGVLDGELVEDGALWGRVNYHWKGCVFAHANTDEYAPHIHIVWSDEGVLYLDTVFTETPEYYLGGNLSQQLRDDYRVACQDLEQSEQLYIAV